MRTLLCTALAGLIAATVLGCDGDTLTFGGGRLNEENDDVNVNGDVDDTRLQTASGTITATPVGRDLIVLVYTDLRCCNANFSPATNTPFRLINFTVPPFDSVELADLKFVDVETLIIAGDTGSFQVGDITDGDITVLFLLDETDPDGTADPGDPVAVVDDPDQRLVDVRPGRTLTLDTVDITFATNFPGGKAEAREIRITSPTAN